MSGAHAPEEAPWRWRVAWMGGPALVVLLLGFPALHGRVPFPTDVLEWMPPWNAAGTPLRPPPDFTRIDSLIQYAANALPYAASLHRGHIDLWDPSIMLGYPLHAGSASLVAPFFPTTLLFGRLLPPPVAITVQPLCLLWLMGVMMAGFLRHVGLHPGAALAGAAAWQCAAGVNAWFAMPVFQIGLWGIPALCWCADRLATRPGPREAALLALLVGVLALGQSPNPMVFGIVVGGAWGVTTLVVAGASAAEWRRSLLWAAAGGVVGLFLGALSWAPMLELLGHVHRPVRMPWPLLQSTRAPVHALLTLLVPEYFGGSWAARSFIAYSLPEVVHGIGLAGLVGVSCAAGHPRRQLTRFAACLGVLGVCVAFGTPVARVAALLPGFGTSVLPRALQLTEWALAVIFAAGVDRLLRGADRRLIVRALAMVILLAACVVTLPAYGPPLVHSLPASVARGATAADLKSHFALGAPWWRPGWVALGIVATGAGAAFLTRRRLVLVIAMVFALLLERRWTLVHQTPWHPAATLYPAVAAMHSLAQQVPPARVLNPAGFPNAVKPLGLASPEGYNPFILRTYLDLLGLAFPGRDFTTYHLLKVPAVGNPLLDLLGVEAVLLPPGAQLPPPFEPHPSVPGLSLNTAAWPRAVVIPHAVSAATVAEAAALMQADRGAWRGRAVVLGPLPPGPRGGRGDARITHYEPDRVEIAVEADGPAYLLLSDQYYPGWHATVDGRPVDILQAFLALRLIPIEAGAHRITFQFRPRSLTLGAALSVTGAVGCMLLLAAHRRYGARVRWGHPTHESAPHAP